MQEKNKNLGKNLILLFVTTLLFVISRCILMIFNYDFETGFFYNRAFATSAYIFSLIFCVILLVVFKKVKTDFCCKYKTTKIVFYANLVLSAAFVGLFILSVLSQNVNTKLEVFTKYLSVITSALSAIFYFASSVFSQRISSKIFQLLNLFPVFYLTSQAISQFTEISGRATTYNLFPDIFSLIILAFFVLKDGKCRILNCTSSLLPISAITFFALAFSAIPDIVTIFTGDLDVTALKALILVLKIVYVFISVNYILDFSKEIKEDV